MDAHSQVEVLRLQCEHLRTLLDQFLAELQNFEHTLAAGGTPTLAPGTPSLNDLGQRSEMIADEAVRLRGFARSLQPQGPDAPQAAPESHPSSSTADTGEK
jgi:hypothetical protein